MFRYNINSLDRSQPKLRQNTSQWQYHVSSHQDISEFQAQNSGCLLANKSIYKAKLKEMEMQKISHTFHMGDYYAITQYLQQQYNKPDTLPIHCLLLDD